MFLGLRRNKRQDQRRLAKEAAKERRSQVEEKISASFGDGSNKDQFMELYKIIVQTSESLVARRQNVNTFFITVNGLLLSAVALIAKDGVAGKRIAVAALVMAFVGTVLCVIWRQLLLSFGQLNTGKFVVINEMEKHLAAPIFDAEWVALAEGRDKKVYRSFTNNEARVPLAIIGIYILIGFGAAVLLSGWFSLPQ